MNDEYPEPSSALDSDSDSEQLFVTAPTHQNNTANESDGVRHGVAAPTSEKNSSISDGKLINVSEEPSQEKVNKSSKPQSTLDELSDATARKIICALGPRSSFFYYCGDPSISWTYLYNDSECPNTVSGVLLEQWRICEPYQVALSPHGAGYFAYSSHTEGLSWRFIDIPSTLRPEKRKLRKQLNKSIEVYGRLKEWLSRNVVTSDDIKTTQVVFGPAARYLAWKSNGDHIASDLPAGFQHELKKQTSIKGNHVFPRRVSFGNGQAWAAIWQDGTHTLFTDKKYPEAEKHHTELSDRQLLYVALDCTDSGPYYMMAFSSTKQSYYMKTSHLTILHKDWDKQMYKWSQQLDTNINSSSKTGGGLSTRTITPEDALKAEAKLSALAADKSKVLAEEAALLSMRSSKKSIVASKVAIAGGVVAIAAACSVM